jgi:predicted ATPase/DNA-binding SARP family transcriptional activator
MVRWYDRIRSVMSTSLPTPITRFVGRARELSELCNLLQSDRLITLTGPGGSGKTRLALQLVSDFSSPVYWIDLSTVIDRDQAADAVRRELGLGEEPDRSSRDLALDSLHDRSALLVFDNCEQIAVAVADLAQALLDHCDGVQIVATSLQPLGLPRERVYAVPPLGLDPHPNPLPSREREHSDAVQLFLDRAREVLPTFETTPDHLALIDAICRRLDGLPLAIELAAARVKVLSLAQIADRLEDALKLLTRGTPAQAARHQTLRAVMQWSYHFLSAAEQTLLRRLSVFAGSFSLDMIEAICAGETDSSLDVLSDLVEKSLVMVLRPSEDRIARYHLLETVRQYAQQQLEAASETERLHDQLLYWATAIAEQTEPELVGPRQREWLQRLTADYANLRSALQFAQQENLFERGLRLATALGRYWWSRGEFTEGLNWLEMFLASAADMSPAATRAKSCQYAAAFLYRQGRLDRAVHFAEESLALRRPLNDDRDIAESLNLLGMIASDASEYAQAEAYYREALRLREAIGEARGTAVVLCNLGYVLRLQGQYDRAHEYYEQSLAYYRQSGDVRGIATVLINLGNIHITRGDLTGARPPFEESLALSQQLGDRWGVVRGTSSLAVLALNLGEYDQAATLLQQTLTLAQAVHDEVSVASTLLNLGLLAYLQNDYGRAAACAEEALTRWQAMQHQWGAGQALTLLGRLACDQGDVQRAVQLLRNALTLYQTLDHQEGLADTLEGLAAVAARQQQYAIAVRRLAVAARLREVGQMPLLPPQQALIDRLLTAARTALGSAAFDRARTTGAALDDQAAIAEVLDETAPSALLGITPEPELRIFALGPARVLVHNRALTSADWTYTKAKELLFYFIAQPPATKAQIGLDVWPDASADQLRNIFHRAMHHLRKALGTPDWIVYADDAYSFNRSLNYWSDLHEFDQHLRVAQTTSRSTAIHHLEMAVQLWRGDFAEDLDAGEWALFQREELRQRYVQALIDLGALHFADAHYDRAAAVYRRLLSLDAYLELAHRELMRCLVRQGEVGHAIQHYQQLRDMLRRELQAEPSPETVMVYERIRRGDEV